MRGNMRYNRLDTSGISIVELLIGVVLLAVVVLSLAASGLYSSRTLSRSRVQLQAAEYLQSELEQLLAVPYDSLRDGSRESSDGTSEWAVEDRYTHRRIILVTHYAPAEAISVWDTVVAFKLAP